MTKTNVIVAAFLVLNAMSFGQVITTNRNPVGMEHNLLFNAATRYIVTQSGSASLNLPILFDGNFQPSYSEVGIDPVNPTIITIEGLPAHHTQAGAIVGWSTRYWPASHFKIEAYNIYANANQWVTVADYSSTVYNGCDFNTWVPGGAYSKLRFTFYSAIGDGGRLGVSELFFLHPEATSPYEGLFTSASSVYSAGGGNVGIGTASPSEKLTVYGVANAQPGVLSLESSREDAGGVEVGKISGKNNQGEINRISLYRDGGSYTGSIGFWTKQSNETAMAESVRIAGSGNVGIGTTTPTEKLSVKGKIRAQEVIVETTGWSDYVFAKDYKLAPLSEVEQHIEQQGHLPGVPSAQEVAAQGVSVGDMQAILLAKIEELTLHVIAQKKNQIAQEKRLQSQDARIQALETENALLKTQTK